jgi:hypothetical protein
MVRPEGVEPPTYWFVANCSIQLSYGRTCCESKSPLLQLSKNRGFRLREQPAPTLEKVNLTSPDRRFQRQMTMRTNDAHRRCANTMLTEYAMSDEPVSGCS